MNPLSRQRAINATKMMILLGLASLFPLSAEIEIFAAKGDPVPARVIGQHGWAPEFQAMMAHPARTIVWKDIENQPFPDKVKVAFRPKDMEELNSLFQLFDKVDARWHYCNVSPDAGIPARFMKSYPKDALNCPLVLEVHSSEYLKQWYLSMPVNAEGQRFTHNRVFDEAPPAAEPALIVFGKHPVVDLDKITWPRWAVVRPLISKQDRAARADDEVLRTIEKLAKEFSAPNCESRRRRRQLEIEEEAL